MIESISMRHSADGVPAGEVSCPTCHSAVHVGKASSEVKRSSGFLLMPSGGQQEQFVSHLARSLAPPLPPRQPSVAQTVGGVVLGWVTGTLLLLLLAGLGAQGLVTLPGAPLAAATFVVYAWFILATERGDENARANRDLTAAELDETARTRAESTARELAQRIP